MSKVSGSSRTDLYREVSDQIIAQIEAGAGEYRMPWHHSGSSLECPTNTLTGDCYRGINVFILWAAARAAGFSTGLWATYRQWSEIGAQVRKGEAGTLAVFWKRVREIVDPATDAADDGGPPRFVARRFWLFNVAQLDGYIAPELPSLPEGQRIAKVEEFVRQLGIEARFGGDRAYYVPSSDYVQMPPFAQFRNAIAYYAVMLHECAHASGAKHRLDRNLSGRFGSNA